MLAPSKQAGHNEKVFSSTSSAPSGIYSSSSLPSGVRNNMAQSNAVLNIQGTHQQRQDSAHQSARAPRSPNRHSNSSFPKPHRHLSEPDNSSPKWDKSPPVVNNTAAPSNIRPPNSSVGELPSSTAGRHLHSSSAPTSPSNERLAARVHQRNFAWKMSPRVCRPDANENRRTVSSVVRKVQEQPTKTLDTGKQILAPDVNFVKNNAVRTTKIKEDMLCRPVDLIIPSKEITQNKVSSVLSDRLSSEVRT